MQRQEQLSGYPAMLHCGHDAVEPVRWTLRSSPGSAVKNITSSDRHYIRGSFLIINSVTVDDSGSYNCTDAAGELHFIQLNVSGELCKQSVL